MTPATDAPALTGGTLSIVIPVYNERDTWRELLQRVLDVDLPGWSKEILLVDDASTDGTTDQLADFERETSLGRIPDTRIQVLYHEINRGKGGALHTGFASAGGELVIIQDADLEYDPRDYPALLAPFAEEGVEVVYGSRFRESGREGYLANYLANRFLTFLSNLTTGQKLTDMETCYKVFRREVIQSLELEQERFGFEPEVTAKLSRRGIRIHEVPIGYHARTSEEGKKIGFTDGLQAIACILRYGLGRR